MAETEEESVPVTGEKTATPPVEEKKAKRGSKATARTKSVARVQEDILEDTQEYTQEYTPDVSGPEASLEEETAASPSIEPAAAVVEAALEDDFEVLEEVGAAELKEAEACVHSLCTSFRMFAYEASDYSKKSFESRALFLGALLGAPSLKSAVELQTSYAEAASARYLALLMKMGGLYGNLLGGFLSQPKR